MATPRRTVSRGVGPLRRLLQEQTFDVRHLDLEGFRRWLEAHLDRWRRDPVFSQRLRIRDLRRATPRVIELERELRRATAADEASPSFRRLSDLEQGLTGADRAVAGLSEALEQAPAERRPGLEAKLADFLTRREALQRDLETATLASPERQQLRRLADEWTRLRADAGLDREEARLAELLRGRGRRSGHSGESFERTALALTRRLIVPHLIRGGESGRVLLLRGVTLGSARVELDQLVVRAPAAQERPVEVLAAVEVKRNINDLAAGFLNRRQDLAWLSGDASGYDPALYRTTTFAAGHFDRPATHEQDGERFLFTPESFRLFRGGRPGLTQRRLYLITRKGPMWGLSGAALSRVSYRLSTAADEPLDRLLEWCRSLAQPVEAPDVIAAHAESPRSARQILLLGP